MDHFDESLWKAKLASKTSKSTKEKKSPVNVSQGLSDCFFLQDLCRYKTAKFFIDHVMDNMYSISKLLVIA
jgi:hypothetical protein